MTTSCIVRAARTSLCTFALLVAGTSQAGLLLNYQFETPLGGTIPNQTTTDSSGTFADAVNEVGGPGTTPGVDYPEQLMGTNLVANSTVKSLNPNSYMYFTGPNATNNDSARVRITDANSGPLDATFSNFTFATWVKPTAVPNDAVTDRLIAGKAGGATPASSNRGWQLSSPPMQESSIGSIVVSGGDDLVVSYYPVQAGGSMARSLVVQDVLPLNTWTHVAFTFASDGVNPGMEAIYINGVAVPFAADANGLTTVPPTLNGANPGSFMTGTRANTSSTGRTTGIFGWVGGLDDVRVYDQALTAAEVQALVAPVTPSHPGDFDGDGDVDSTDFAAWQLNFPTSSGAAPTQGDADGDGDVDGADFIVWQTNFPYTPTPAVAAVPEPMGMCLLSIGAIGLFLSQKFCRNPVQSNK